MSAAAGTPRHRWLAPEVVQTSAMDCGPATLKSLLEGRGISVSYGRLREACQTDVDGTSIDTIEAVAEQLGLAVEQISIPADHLLLDTACTLPAIVVTRQRDSSLHFVVVWRRHGQWLQVMDPAIGRRWIKQRAFLDEVYKHEQHVPAADWRNWSSTNDNLQPLRERLRSIGADPHHTATLVDSALRDVTWFTFAALDAAVRLVQSIIAAGGLRVGTSAASLAQALVERTCRTTESASTGREIVNIYDAIPPHYWSVAPDPTSADATHPELVLRGVVLVRVQHAVSPGAAAAKSHGETPPLSTELRAALDEKPLRPLATAFSMLKVDGLLAPMALIGAIVLAAGGILVETLLFRGLFDMTSMLNQPIQRLGAIAALIAFAMVLLVIQVPIMAETARFGRHLETRLRMALLEKLPRLKDSYFNSRPVSDMAERSHSIQAIRNLPAMGLQFVQVMCELLFTLTGILLIDARSFWTALGIAMLAVSMSAAAQPLINERDLRVRNHAGALYGFYLDALLGLVPIRTHGAGKAVSRLHEGLLTEWLKSSTRLIRFSQCSTALQGLLCIGLAAWMLFDHFVRAGGVTGADLLLVYWALKLPSIAKTISGLALAYPAQRNALLRLMEPLTAPDEVRTDVAATDSQALSNVATSARIDLKNAHVIASGHTILRDVNLRITPGEHVAIVGRSGAGKSTLLGMMLGWHRTASGRLLIDGAELDSERLDALRRQTAWIDPSVQLWNKSFCENIAYASEVDSLNRVDEVIEVARLREILQKLPHGLQHLLGEGGGLLSGGEGQRVRLARALLQRDVRLVLLDEPFRGMDRTHRSALLGEVRLWWPNATLLCVTHDVCETKTFSRVLVVEDGHVIEDDSPAALMQRDSRYRHLIETESSVRQQLWQGRQWRHLHMIDGRLEESRS